MTTHGTNLVFIEIHETMNVCTEYVILSMECENQYTYIFILIIKNECL